MSKQTRELSAEPIGVLQTNGEQDCLVTEIDYDKGGGSRPRGYYLRVSVEGRNPREGTVSFFLSSVRHLELIEGAKAFSAKRLALITVAEDRIKAARDKVRTAYENDQFEKARRRACEDTPCAHDQGGYES